jgi:broad specificity phosphatase PhoE
MNDAGLVCGLTDSPLSPAGMRHLEKASKFRLPDGWGMLSSPLVRCIQTGSMLFNNFSPVICEELIEVDYGKLEGKSTSAVEEELTRFGENWATLSDSPMQKYVCNAQKILNHKNPKLAAVTHGGVINFIVGAALDIEPRKFPFLTIDNLHCVVLHGHNEKWRVQFANRDTNCLLKFFG